MSDKLDKQIDEAFKRKATLALDGMLEKIIKETMQEHGLTFDNNDEIQPLLEALDGYVDKSESVPSILSEEADPQAQAAVKQFLASLPKMEISERWGDPTSQTREELKKFTENIGGKSIQEKFSNLMQIQNASSRISAPARIIASLVLLESLRAMITTANASSAGFAFEGFMAALMNGRQVADPDDGSLPIEDVVLFTFEDVKTTKTRPGQKVSLKMLKGGTGATQVHGSFTNMVEALWQFPEGMAYVVGYKMNQDQEDFHIRLTENLFTKENFYNIFTGPGGAGGNKSLFVLDDNRVKMLIRALPDLKKEILARKADWEGTLSSGQKADELTLQMLRCTSGYSAQKFIKKLSPQQVQEASSKADGGDQWHMKASYYATDEVTPLGELKLSASAIENTAMQYSKVLRGSIAQVFQAVAELGTHVNGYFVGKKRDEAIASGNEAIKDTKKITSTLSKDLKQREQDSES